MDDGEADRKEQHTRSRSRPLCCRRVLCGNFVSLFRVDFFLIFPCVA